MCLEELLCLLSCQVVYDSLVTLLTVALQAFLSMGFPRQEYWSGRPFPSEIFPTHGMNLRLLHGRQILYHLSHLGNPLRTVTHSWAKSSNAKPIL